MGYIEEVNEALAAFPPFWQRVGECRFTEDALDTLQINIGLKCNLACKHCHVESSPARTEEMSRETLEQCLTVFRDRGFKTIDITGGAPEMNPNYEWLLHEAVGAGANVMTRSNLSICKEPGYEHIPKLWAELGITVIASLPHYVKKTSEKQRGAGTFDPTIEMLQRLCALGYGKGEGAGPGGKKLELLPAELQLVLAGRVVGGLGVGHKDIRYAGLEALQQILAEVGALSRRAADDDHAHGAGKALGNGRRVR